MQLLWLLFPEIGSNWSFWAKKQFYRLNTHSVSQYSWISDMTICLARSQALVIEICMYVPQDDMDIEIQCRKLEDVNTGQGKGITTA